MTQQAVVDYRAGMAQAIDVAATARTRTSPNPWVGAVVFDPDGRVAGTGATQPPGSAHAEVLALQAAGEAAAGGTLVVTLEPCSHHGRTPPCVDAILAAGVARVVIGLEDPDPRVSGRGIAALRAAGVHVDAGIMRSEVASQLQPYLHHRRTGRPFVVCKLAATLDGGIAATDGSSKWITGDAARTDVHRVRAESDAIIVGAATVRTDDPSLTVRHVEGRDPLRVVLGRAPAGARVHPCLEWTRDLDALLVHLGSLGVLQAMVEGGAKVVRSFHDRDLIDRYIVYVAPKLLGGRDVVPLIGGPSAPSIDAAWLGRFDDVRQVGCDVRLDVIPSSRGTDA